MMSLVYFVFCILLNFSHKSWLIFKIKNRLNTAGPDVFKTPPKSTILPSFGEDTYLRLKTPDTNLLFL